MTKKATGIVSYITLIGWLIAYFAGDREGAKFHLNQSLMLAILELIVSIVFGVLTKIPLLGIVFALVQGILGIVLLVFWIMGLIHAINEEEKPLPIIGGIQLLK